MFWDDALKINQIPSQVFRMTIKHEIKKEEDLIRILSAQHTEAAERMRFRRTVRKRMVAQILWMAAV